MANGHYSYKAKHLYSEELYLCVPDEPAAYTELDRSFKRQYSRLFFTLFFIKIQIYRTKEQVPALKELAIQSSHVYKHLTIPSDPIFLTWLTTITS